MQPVYCILPYKILDDGWLVTFKYNTAGQMKWMCCANLQSCIWDQHVPLIGTWHCHLFKESPFNCENWAGRTVWFCCICHSEHSMAIFCLLHHDAFPVAWNEEVTFELDWFARFFFQHFRVSASVKWAVWTQGLTKSLKWLSSWNLSELIGVQMILFEGTVFESFWAKNLLEK